MTYKALSNFFLLTTTPRIIALSADDMPSAAKILLHQKNAQQQSSEGGNRSNMSESADLLRTEAELLVDQVISQILTPQYQIQALSI